MDSKMPEKWSKNWILYYLKTTLISIGVGLILAVVSSLIVGHGLFGVEMVYLTLIIAVIHLVNTLWGVIDNRDLYYIQAVTLSIATVFSMIAVAADFGGWAYYSAALLLVVYICLGFIVGVITQVVRRLRYRDTMHMEKPDLVLLKPLMLLYIFTCLVVGLAVVAPMFMVALAQPDSVDVFNRDIKIEPYTVVYTEGTAEYQYKIFLDSDKKELIHESYTTDFDTSIVPEAKMEYSNKYSLSEAQLKRLYFMLFEKYDIFSIDEDLSTKDSIMDAPAAFLEVTRNGDQVNKIGGYYPFENKQFRMFKSELYDLIKVEAETSEVTHPDEYAGYKYVGTFVSNIHDELEACSDASVTVGEWDYTEGVYSIESELEFWYPNTDVVITGQFYYDVKTEQLNFQVETIYGLPNRLFEVKQAMGRVLR